MDDKIFHLVVRFSDKLFPLEEVIEKHNKVVSKFGYVWFGIFGSAISESHIEILNQQIAKGFPTYIYLVSGNRKKFTFYKANLLEITRQFPAGIEKCFPEYYAKNDLLKEMSIVQRVHRISPIDEASAVLDQLPLNSAYSVYETLTRSSSGYFLVYDAKNLD